MAQTFDELTLTRDQLARAILAVELTLAETGQRLRRLREAVEWSEALLRGEAASPAAACRCEMEEHGEGRT